ncbi:MAG: hypothetical protein ACREA9_15365 [Pyrinomonadaceae bacterium]
MTISQTSTEFLFSYGTLQLEAVQMATFGRLLAGTSDALSGFEQVTLKIEDDRQVHRARLRCSNRNSVPRHTR